MQGNMYMKEGRLEDVADPKLGGQYDKEALYAMAEVASECTKEKSRQRPDMTVVLTKLVEVQLKLRGEEAASSLEPSRELSMDVRLRQEDLKHWMMPKDK